MAEYLSPGVYVEEFDSGIKAMEGVGTSTAGFVGMAQKGPVKGLPVLLTSMADYQRYFGGYLSQRVYQEMRWLPYAVEQFFQNGGSTCYAMRVCPADAKAAVSDNKFFTMEAASPGAWGNQLHGKFALLARNKVQDVKFEAGEGESGSKVFSCTLGDASAFREGDLVYLQPAPEGAQCFNRIQGIDGNKVTLAWDPMLPEGGGENGDGGALSLSVAEWNLTVWDSTLSENYEGVSFNPDSTRYLGQVLGNSSLATVKVDLEQLTAEELGGRIQDKKEPEFEISFQGGEDGTLEFLQSLYIGGGISPDERTGLEAFKTLSDVSIMAIPGITDPAVQSALVSHCEGLGNRFAILDMPLAFKEVAKLQEFRENVDSSYAAMYHPWIKCYDPLENRNTFFPPSGAMAGIYGRTDNTRGVHKAPANEVVRNCTGLSVRYNEAEQGKLNPKGINLIRAIPGQGIRVWGARTCSSDGNWKYINVRRLFVFVEESIRANTGWAVFEPNDEMLWSRVEGTIRVFLTTQWRNGALAGNSAEEAFFINIGRSTMTEDDILNGRLICVIGIAPVRPAEFVVFRITQKMESAQ